MGDKIERIKVFDAVTVALSSSELSVNIKLSRKIPTGSFAFDYELTGDGTAQFELAVPHGDVEPGAEASQTFLVPSGSSAFGTAITDVSGPGSNGIDYLAFAPPVATDLKIKVSETGGTNAVVITGWVILQ